MLLLWPFLSLWIVVESSLINLIRPANLRRESDEPNPEAFMTTPELVKHRGYPIEIHSVTTEDGYILQLHRIPHGIGNVIRRNKPVYLQHGLLGASSDWVLNPSDQALGFILADRGYDVWLGNFRGNTYSRNHTKLDPNGAEFWKFSYDQLGFYDIPAAIDYILKTTSSQKLVYIGHSMGCTAAFIALSTQPQLNQKIDLLVNLAPAASMVHMRTAVKTLAPYFRQIQWFLELIGTRDFLSRDDWPRRLQKTICGHGFKNTKFCLNAIFLLAGVDKSHFNVTLLPVVEGHNPTGTSVRVLAQFAQNYNAGIKYGQRFVRFDYGRRENSRLYGQPDPPSYNLSLITTPNYIFWSQDDFLCAPQDIQWLSGRIGNLKQSIRIERDTFNHLDFIWNSHVKQLVYDQVLNLLP